MNDLYFPPPRDFEILTYVERLANSRDPGDVSAMLRETENYASADDLQIRRTGDHSDATYVQTDRTVQTGRRRHRRRLPVYRSRRPQCDRLRSSLSGRVRVDVPRDS